ncbi:hypothetical protein [Nocardiopsis ganjiahuensis]|uniref:hypothetical protein n=1 Tax=Nocardiopsis ganjiahuensis TaxID=239984 RepID=UPI000348E4B4|nr:hypothetical protein [Nocardiopsis ganjiahuensis]
MVKALTALGLTARLSSKQYCNSHEIQVEEVESGQDATLYLDAEGGANWGIWGIWGETPYERHTTVQDITTAITGRLRAPLAAND